MRHIGTVSAVVTAGPSGVGPSDAELDAIEWEMPLIRAEVELLDAQITTLDRVPSEVDGRRIRRARCKVLAARRAVANRAAASGGAA